MNSLSVCSGVGGMDLGLHRAGIRTVGFCEIDPTARAILAHHFPDVPCHDDLTTLNGHDWHGRIDLVHGGTPCTDLSMAGRRDGLGGEHSRIYWDFIRVARDSAARWVLWENVAGALSSNRGADFAAVLWGLSGHHPGVPTDGWRTIGVCVGVERAVVWRLFDARWFGVAQRRRRVFALGCPVADVGRAIQVLLEPESVCRDSRPSGQAGEAVAALTATGVGTCGADNQAQAGHIIGTLTSRGGWENRNQGENLIVANTLMARDAKGAPTRIDAGQGNLVVADVVSFGWQENSTWASIVDEPGTCRTLETTKTPAVFVSENQRGELQLTDYARSLTSGGGKPGQGYPAALTTDLAVRRLLPVECERLMGWPDDWTATANDRPVADSHRYRACGNGVVANVTEWIGRRLMKAAP